MIRDDDAGVVRLDRIALDAHGAADDEEEELRRGASDAPAAQDPGVTASTTHSGRTMSEQREPGIEAVAQMEDPIHD